MSDKQKIKQLEDKIVGDYAAYKERALKEGKETLFNNSYYNAICAEWNCYLDGWIGGGENELPKGALDALLRLDNIFKQLVDHVGKYDTIGFNSEDFWNYLEDFVT